MTLHLFSPSPTSVTFSPPLLPYTDTLSLFPSHFALGYRMTHPLPIPSIQSLTTIPNKHLDNFKFVYDVIV